MQPYFTQIGLTFTPPTSLNTFVEASLSLPVPNFTSKDVQKLYHYKVPSLSEGPGCGLPAKEPYRLEKTLLLEKEDLKTHENTKRLWILSQIVKKLQYLTQVDWLGVYRKTKNLAGEDILLKEAYFGRLSRAEFPLTEDFAKKSNNTTVGLTKKAILVQNVEKYQGPYYVCDQDVQSEFCVPILSPDNTLLGIIDAEAFTPNFFTEQKVAEITKVAKDLGGIFKTDAALPCLLPRHLKW